MNRQILLRVSQVGSCLNYIKPPWRAVNSTASGDRYLMAALVPSSANTDRTATAAVTKAKLAATESSRTSQVTRRILLICMRLPNQLAPAKNSHAALCVGADHRDAVNGGRQVLNRLMRQNSERGR